MAPKRSKPGAGSRMPKRLRDMHRVRERGEATATTFSPLRVGPEREHLCRFNPKEPYRV